MKELILLMLLLLLTVHIYINTYVHWYEIRSMLSRSLRRTCSYSRLFVKARIVTDRCFLSFDRELFLSRIYRGTFVPTDSTSPLQLPFISTASRCLFLRELRAKRRASSCTTRLERCKRTLSSTLSNPSYCYD